MSFAMRRDVSLSASTDFNVTYRFPARFELTGLHIHSGRAGENGPVTIDSAISGAEPVVQFNGPRRS